MTGPTAPTEACRPPLFDFHARLSRSGGGLPELLGALSAAGVARAAVAAGGVVDLDRLSANLVEGGHVTDASADNEAVLAACAGSDGRLVPFYLPNPYQPAEAYRRDAHRYAGLELSPAVYGVGFDDPRTVELVRIAARAGHPVYTVCLGRPGSRPADLVRLARQFPDVPFVSGHCGFIGIDTHGIGQVASQPNIAVETSGCFLVTARVAIGRLGPDRVVFGSEYPLSDPTVELAKLAALGLGRDSWEKVTWRNAHRLLFQESP